MGNAAILRSKIEVALGARNPAALSARPKAEIVRVPCGVTEVDELLHGGLPVGSVVEFVGAECSGRTTMALGYLAALTQAGNVCAWIDVSDVLDPESVAAHGVDLERLLWVRCGAAHQKTFDGPLQARHGVSSPFDMPVPARHTGGGSPHPRSEGRDMPQAISSLLQAHGGLYDRQRRESKVGTPGAPNRSLPQQSGYRSEHREEQVNSDRLPPRRGDNLAIVARCAEPLPRRVAQIPSAERLPHDRSTPASLPQTLSMPGTVAGKPWTAIDQALRCADLLLQSGGFSAIVLDLGSTPPEFAWRIPLATWFRFRAACERTRMSLVLLTQHPCARSSAELVVRLQAGTMDAESTVMTGIRYRAATERSRAGDKGSSCVVPIRKPPQPERAIRQEHEVGRWKSEAVWAQAN